MSDSRPWDSKADEERAAGATRLCLAGLVPFSVILFTRLHARSWYPEGTDWTLAGAVGVLLAGALAVRPVLHRASVLGGAALFMAAVWSPLADAPATALLVLVLATVLVERVFAWTLSAPGIKVDRTHAMVARSELVVISLLAVGAWLIVPPPTDSVAWVASLVLALFAGATSGRYLDALHPGWRRYSLTLLIGLWGVALLFFLNGHPRLALAAVCIAPAAPLLFDLGGSSSDLESFADATLGRPAQLLVTTFIALCVVGTLLLNQSSAHALGPVSLLDAAFTAVSAVCVTGLIVLDTPSAFSVTGQAFILLLIQVGGLGIMAFSSGALVLLGRRLSLRHEAALVGLFAGADRRRLVRVLARTFAVTFGFELAGAGILALAFRAHGDSVPDALWRGVFTAVSAFCNAGFALQADSLIPYQSDPVVLHTVGLLVVAGGLSPLVVAALFGRVLGRRVRSAQVSAVLALTTALLLVGFVGFLAMEWDASLGELGLWDRLHNAWFQSITLRTAGFNSVDLVATRSSTQSLMMLLMFIGGAPGGIAGGIKVTTALVLALAVVAAIRGLPVATAFGRSFSHRTVYQAAAIATLAAGWTFLTYIALQLTQSLPDGVALFEAVSALGTVGLSIGGTGQLDDVGKILIIVAMFLGRVGPLTTFLFLAGREVRTTWRAPEQELDVG